MIYLEIAAIVALVFVVTVSLWLAAIVLLDRMIPESDCTGECEQGRRCTCCKENLK